jgi:L-ascorbate metabolism protein UlaG (beta-lactamase superfamily)
MSLTLTRHGHACVRVATDSGALVVDPGAFSDLAAALEGVEHVLVTHAHPDHLDAVALAERDVHVHGPGQVLDALAEAGVPPERRHLLTPGDRLEVAGAVVEVLDAPHEVIHPEVPLPTNVALLVDGVVLHPGDAFVRPPAGVVIDVLLEPVGAPWLRAADMVEHVRAVRPRRVVPVHDGTLSEAGRSLALSLLGNLTEAEVLTPAPGEPVLVD